MMKPIDEEGRGLKLNSLKELLKTLKSSGLSKLPKGKGVSMMSVSVSKPKNEEVEEESMEDEMSPESLMSEHSSEDDMEGSESMEPSDSVEEESSEEDPSLESPEEDDDEFKLREPEVPEELLELVMQMLKNKKEQE